ncbi:hypothetical protein NFI96_001615 [Prochilodus magdalenae]|nr:hypothetical protein NFI96_001615 [Prochilodus magdalenae]
MTIIWIFIFILPPAGVSAVTIVHGHRGHSVQIRCSYESGYKTNMKYLCRGACSTLPWGKKDIPVQSGSTAKDQRFSLDDHTAARVFTITITDLRSEDGGTYWCGIQRPNPLSDIYTEVLLAVNLGPPPSDPRPPVSYSTQSTCPPTLAPTAGVSAVTTVTGRRGHSVQIRCSYESGYETVQSGSTARDQRFSLNNDKAARVFTITITDLRPEDGGTYWCGIQRSKLPHIYKEVLLLVKPDPPPPPVSYSKHSLPSSVQTQSTRPPPLALTGPLFVAPPLPRCS